jgi:hypothetical protein
MNTVLKQITDLTERAIAEKSIGIPILSVFKTSEALNHLYGTLAEKGIISESDEEKQERIGQYVAAQKAILTKLKEIASRERPPPPGPKVEEVPPEAAAAPQTAQGGEPPE